jgi:hypothetical protein
LIHYRVVWHIVAQAEAAVRVATPAPEVAVGVDSQCVSLPCREVKERKTWPTKGGASSGVKVQEFIRVGLDGETGGAKGDATCSKRRHYPESLRAYITGKLAMVTESCRVQGSGGVDGGGGVVASGNGAHGRSRRQRKEGWHLDHWVVRRRGRDVAQLTIWRKAHAVDSTVGIEHQHVV